MRRKKQFTNYDISCQHSAQQQTRRAPLLLSVDGTGRRTTDLYVDPAARPERGIETEGLRSESYRIERAAVVRTFADNLTVASTSMSI